MVGEKELTNNIGAIESLSGGGGTVFVTFLAFTGEIECREHRLISQAALSGTAHQGWLSSRLQ